MLRAALRVLGMIRSLLLTVGVAALAATAATWLMPGIEGGTSEWTVALRSFAIQVTIVFLVAAAGAAAVMPSPSMLKVATSAELRSPAALTVLPLLAALAGLALLQAPSVASWWTGDRALLAEAMGPQRDPIGLHLIPEIILLSLPALSGVAILVFVMSSAAGSLVRADLRVRVLAACVLIQAGVVGGEYVILRALRTLGGTVQTLVGQSPDQKAIDQVAAFLTRHDAASGDVSVRLVWLLCGYGVALAVAGVMAGRATAESTDVT